MLPAQSLEKRIVALVAAVQFVNIVDFMIVMPLGPFFAAGLHIPTAHIGYVGGAYTAAAAVAGALGALFLDRFDRRKALAVALLGLVIGTAMGGLSTGFPSLIAARVMAGMFGGPATALAMALVTDVVPPERRGRAMSLVMASFSAASVLGVPAGLVLAGHLSWRAPFFAVAALGAIVGTLAIFLMPPMKLHLERGITTRNGAADAVAFFARREVWLALAGMGTAMAGAFAVIPNLATYFIHNRAYPAAGWAGIPGLYFVGGLFSFAVVLVAGRSVDRHGATRIAAIGTVLSVAVLLLGFVFVVPGVPVPALFIGFMSAMSFRGVAMGSLVTKVPRPFERARYMSTQSVVQHVASSLGAFAGAQMLTSRPDGGLDGMPVLASFSLVLFALLPFLMGALERRIAVARPAAPVGITPPT